MLKKIILLLVILLVTGCKESKEEQRKIYYGEAPVPTETTTRGTPYEDRNTDIFIYDVNGVILDKKVEENGCNGTLYYFFIELETGEFMKWGVTEVKYMYKDKGDAVWFDYLRKDRFHKEVY